MKVIELLNKIANGEEVPKKIKYDSDTYYYIEDNREGVCYINTALDKENIWSHFLYNIDTLNDEVEIIEEKGIPEKLEYQGGFGGTDQEVISEYVDDVVEKVNEIIDYLQSKGEKND